MTTRWIAFVILAIFFLFLTPTDTIHNGPFIISGELMHGRPYLPKSYSWMESYHWNGHDYIGYPPWVTLALVPLQVVSFGHGTQPLFNTLFILGSVILFYILLRKTPSLFPTAFIGTVAFALGTSNLYSVNTGNLWLLMHSEGNFFLLLALCLALFWNRWGWSGFAFMIAAQCRHSILFSIVSFIGFAWGPAIKTKAWKFGLGASVPAITALCLQAWMTGSPWISPYHRMLETWNTDQPQFGLRYIWNNLAFYLFAHPHFESKIPWIRFDNDGQSIWLMSPFVLGIFLLKFRNYQGTSEAKLAESQVKLSLIAGSMSMFLFYLIYYWNGYSQFGARYLQDLYPILIPAALLGFDLQNKWKKNLLNLTVGFAIFMNAYGTWVMAHYSPR